MGRDKKRFDNPISSSPPNGKPNSRDFRDKKGYETNDREMRDRDRDTASFKDSKISKKDSTKKTKASSVVQTHSSSSLRDSKDGHHSTALISPPSLFGMKGFV